MIGKIRARRRPTTSDRRVLPVAARRRPGAETVGSRDVLPASEAAPAERGFRIVQRLHGDCSVLAPVGELDSSTVLPFEQAVTDVVRRGRPIVIDLDSLSFIDSCGLWSISLIYSACKQRGIGICLWSGPEHVQHVFEVTGLYDLLPFTDRFPEEAL
jgi:anti-anti-sigma factor